MAAPNNEKRTGSPIWAGLGGFLLGAGTVLFILWLYRTPAGHDVGDRGGSQASQDEEGPAAGSPSPSSPPAPPPPGTEGGERPAEGSDDSRPWLQVPSPVATGELARRGLLVPVQGIGRDQLQNTFEDSRGAGERVHNALDIMAPEGTPVLAVEDGKIEKLFTSKQGGLTIYQFDGSRTYAYYYAHLQKYAANLKEGQTVRKGEVIGHVGITGNASPEGPHLHFAIYRLTPEKQWWKGDPLNPFDVLSGRRGRGDGGEPSR